MESLIIQLVSGAVGGNVAGQLFKQYSLGTLGNTIAGVVGGGLGGQLLATLTPSLMNGELAGYAGQAVGSGVGGLVVMFAVAVVKQMMAGRKTA
jgi:uncharacterized membrane protein YeaQ/YmgE (transglycosylase-associated protein family)